MIADEIVQWVIRFTVVVGAIGAVLALWQTRQTRGRVDQVHVLVNGRMTAVTARVNQLVQVLHEHGIEVPPDPADPVLVLPPVGPGADPGAPVAPDPAP